MLKIETLELVFENGSVKVSMEELKQLQKEINSLISETDNEESFKKRFEKLEEEIGKLPKNIPPIWPLPYPWIDINPILPNPYKTPPYGPPIVWCRLSQADTSTSGGFSTSVSLSPQDVGDKG